VYGYKYPIQDCRSGNCFPGYLWWNGYIPANRINSVDASGKPNGIMGVPADYKPAQAPLISRRLDGIARQRSGRHRRQPVLGYQYGLDAFDQRHRTTYRLQRQHESVPQPVHPRPAAMVPGRLVVSSSPS
jgi:hypothetical protein